MTVWYVTLRGAPPGKTPLSKRFDNEAAAREHAFAAACAAGEIYKRPVYFEVTRWMHRIARYHVNANATPTVVES